MILYDKSFFDKKLFKIYLQIYDLFIDNINYGEFKLIKETKNIKISSTKSSIGHLLGAAGSVESIFSILSIKNNTVPATLNLDNPSHKFDIDLVAKFPQDHEVNFALNNSFGFGGTNTALLFSSY